MNLKTKISGKVVKHRGRGKQLGYPTANLDAETSLEDGVYLGLVKEIKGVKLPPLFLRKLLPHAKVFSTENGLPATVFIGKADTFEESDRTVEVYILDFSHDIYDAELEVEIIKKIRSNQKFDSAEDLIEQLKQDELVARQFFASYNKDN